ncbi:MAG: hypothetical protein BAJALOKI1v1_820016 [Promethearchaeota archaeon]|nr:MAG: hypothetical protein BAJALOKI1v1_820016 [Candidatus Lokiarchaeota archaeon]
MRSFLNKLEVKEFSKPIEHNQLANVIQEYGENPIKLTVSNCKFPIIVGLINNREKVALALGVEKTDIIPFIIERLNNLKPCNLTTNAPFLENKIVLSLTESIDDYLPIIDFYGGKKYTTSSLVICDFPGEERQNVSFHRMMYLGNNRFSIRVVPQRHLDKAYQNALENGKDLTVAIVFGVHPVIELAAAFSAPNMDELELAAAILNGLDLIQLPNGIKVPAKTEFVIEGRITEEVAFEGPFIDLTGTADIIREQPVFVADIFYFRTNPLFRTILPGGKEHRMLMGIPQEPRIFKGIQNTIPTLKNVILTQGGCSWLHSVVQIRKRTEGDAKNAILAALAAHPSLKRVIIVDEDIDITNSEDVEWAVATRVQPDKDVLLIPNSKGSSLDPSSDNSITTKWGIDATKPLKNNDSFNKVKF